MLYTSEAPAMFPTDASACKGMLWWHGVGKVEHLFKKELWCQGAIATYGVVVHKIPRDMNGGDIKRRR